MVQVTYSHRLNAAGIRALINSPQGGIARDMLLRAKLVETQAKRNLNGGESGPRRRDTGRLISSILGTVIMMAAVVGSGFYVDLVDRLSLVSRGTRPLGLGKPYLTRRVPIGCAIGTRMTIQV